MTAPIRPTARRRCGGGGRTAGFEGLSAEGFALDGDVVSGWLGMDWRRSDLLLGLAASHSRGVMDYEDLDAVNREFDAEIEADLTSVYPYARYSLNDALDVWGIAGVGTGRLGFADGFGRNATDIDMWMAAAGMRRALGSWSRHDIDFAVKADALSAVTRFRTAGAGLARIRRLPAGSESFRAAHATGAGGRIFPFARVARPGAVDAGARRPPRPGRVGDGRRGRPRGLGALRGSVVGSHRGGQRPALARARGEGLRGVGRGRGGPSRAGRERAGSLVQRGAVVGRHGERDRAAVERRPSGGRRHRGPAGKGGRRSSVTAWACSAGGECSLPISGPP